MPTRRAAGRAVDATLVARLAAAHRGGDAVRFADALAPRDLAAAYAMQADVAATLGAEVAGWKVGIRPDGTAMAAPIYADLVKPSGGTWPIPAAGPLIVEVELAFRLEDDLPLRAEAYTREEIEDAVSEVLVGIELIHWRFASEEPPPFLAFLADNLGNAGYIMGEGTRDFRSLDLARRRCLVSVDAELAHDKIGGHPQDDPYTPLLACLAQGQLGLGGFRAGQIVTTGSLIVPLRPARPTVVRAELVGIGTVAAAFVR